MPDFLPGYGLEMIHLRKGHSFLLHALRSAIPDQLDSLCFAGCISQRLLAPSMYVLRYSFLQLYCLLSTWNLLLRYPGTAGDLAVLLR